MNILLTAASLLSLLMALVHVFAGGPEVHDPLLAAAPSRILGAYVSIIWHATTLFLAVNSVALMLAAVNTRVRPTAVAMVAVQYLGYAAIFLGYGLADVGSVTDLPQWSGFIVVSGLAVAGAVIPTRSSQTSRAAPMA